MSEYTIENTCRGCIRSFTTKQNYERHTNTCKELAIKISIESISIEYEKKLKSVSAEYEKEIDKLRKEVEDTKSLLRKHGIIRSNNSYRERFDYTYNKLLIFTTEHVVNNIQSIRYQSMLTLGENTVNTNFILYFVNAIKKFVFCTDTTRYKLVIKRENNICEKIKAHAFIVECFTKAHSELILLLNNSIQYCMSQEPNLPYEDYTTSMNQLILLRTYLSQLGVNKLVKMIVNNLVTNCDVVIKN